jgi:hypothetical protein
MKATLAEFDFRYSIGIATCIDANARSHNALSKVVGKRLTYSGPRARSFVVKAKSASKAVAPFRLETTKETFPQLIRTGD